MILYLFTFLAVIGFIVLLWATHELYESAKKNDWVIG